MNKEQIIASFAAFHINAVSNIIYLFQTNMWFVLITVCAVLFLVLSVRDELSFVLVEKQNKV